MVDTQDTPIEDGHSDAGAGAKLSGIIAQVRADGQLGHDANPRESLRQRLLDAGISLTEAEFDEALTEVQAN